MYILIIYIMFYFDFIVYINYIIIFLLLFFNYILYNVIKYALFCKNLTLLYLKIYKIIIDIL